MNLLNCKLIKLVVQQVVVLPAGSQRRINVGETCPAGLGRGNILWVRLG